MGEKHFRAVLIFIFVAGVVNSSYSQNYIQNFGLTQPQDPSSLPASKIAPQTSVRKPKPKEVFYDLCDEYGMLVWNDFWLSTEGYNLNVNDNSLFMANATDVVKRFRNHPSIAIWCPRNEGYAPLQIEPQLQALIATEDGTRLYQPNSRYLNLRPSGPWQLHPVPANYIKDVGGFNTEIGIPSVPTAESMCKMMAEEDVWPISDVWAYHDFHDGQKLKFAQPFQKRYKEILGTGKASLHICGRTDNIIEEMVKTGFDVLELDHQNNTEKSLKTIAGRASVWGNLNPSSMISFGTPKMIINESKRIFEAAKKYAQNRFVLCPGCLVNSDVPPENIQAMTDAVMKYGYY